MKKMVTILSLVLASSTVFANELNCKIKVIDTSEIGRIENGKAIVVKEGQTSQMIDKSGADIMFSLPSDTWHDYATLYIHAHADKNGKISAASVSDEIKNINVPMSVNSNRKKSQLSYSHGGVLVDQIYETLEIEASCEVK